MIKIFLKISKYWQESCRPALFTGLQNSQVFSSDYSEKFKNTSFEELLLAEQLPMLPLLLSSNNLLTGYEQSSY